MNKIDIRQIIEERYPAFKQRPAFVRNLAIGLLERVLHLKEVNDIIETNKDVYGIQFIENVFERLNFSFSISHKDIQKIPAEGRIICVSNHPIGSLDGLSLLWAVSNIRPDVKIIANDILYNIENLRSHFLPFNLDSPKAQKNNIIAIGEALEREEAIIIFPAAEVSRLSGFRVMDKKWNKGPIFFAKKFNSPVLPMFVKAKNSGFFYIFSLIHKSLSMVLLSHEMFNKKNKTIQIKVGDQIPAKIFVSNVINVKNQARLLRKHVYSVGRDKTGVFVTETNIIHPVDKKVIKKELNSSELLGITPDGKKIFLADMEGAPNVLKELARLREITFRKVGEGTGKKLDLDDFDRIYKHIIVWDENELDIIGAYRIAPGKEIMNTKGPIGFYTSTLFNYSITFETDYLPVSIELGRSFVQKKYWNTNALHYLWQGIGAYLAHNPDVKYMFGGVSISNNYPVSAQRLIVYYFNKWYGGGSELASSKTPFKLPEKFISQNAPLFDGDSARKDYFNLKNLLKPYGFTVPVLYKHYTELCAEGGVKFLDFGVDPDFENCIDGFILVDVSMVKPEKRERYITPFL